MSALTGIRIVELAESVAGEYCGKLLADFGAEVIKIERPHCGSPTRAMAPIIGDGGGPERSALFAYLNTNKRSVVLDVSSADEIETLHKIIATTNAVVDDHAPSWSESVGLSATDIPRRHPAVVFCSITPYGAQAPPGFHKRQEHQRIQQQRMGLPHTQPCRFHQAAVRGPAVSSPTTRPGSTRHCA